MAEREPNLKTDLHQRGQGVQFFKSNHAFSMWPEIDSDFALKVADAATAVGVLSRRCSEPLNQLEAVQRDWERYFRDLRVDAACAAEAIDRAIDATIPWLYDGVRS